MVGHELLGQIATLESCRPRHAGHPDPNGLGPTVVARTASGSYAVDSDGVDSGRGVGAAREWAVIPLILPGSSVDRFANRWTESAAGEPRRQGAFLRTQRGGTDAAHGPGPFHPVRTGHGLAGQCGRDPLPHLRLVLRPADEHGP